MDKYSEKLYKEMLSDEGIQYDNDNVAEKGQLSCLSFDKLLLIV